MQNQPKVPISWECVFFAGKTGCPECWQLQVAALQLTLLSHLLGGSLGPAGESL